LEEIWAEVARIYRDYLPDRLAGMGQDEQAAMFDRIAETVLDEGGPTGAGDESRSDPGGNGPARASIRTIWRRWRSAAPPGCRRSGR
jgi:hypothetical protein